MAEQCSRQWLAFLCAYVPRRLGAMDTNTVLAIIGVVAAVVIIAAVVVWAFARKRGAGQSQSAESSVEAQGGVPAASERAGAAASLPAVSLPEKVEDRSRLDAVMTRLAIPVLRLRMFPLRSRPLPLPLPRPQLSGLNRCPAALPV